PTAKAPPPQAARAPAADQTTPIRMATPGVPEGAALLPAGAAAPAAALLLAIVSDRGVPGWAPSTGKPSAPATAAPLLAIPAPALAPAAAAAVTPPAAHPAQDFSALIDRLVAARSAAREGVAPQPVTAALTHGEFGQVALSFRQDGERLAVSMASRDPDFARAAQDALAAQPPAVAAPAASAGFTTSHGGAGFTASHGAAGFAASHGGGQTADPRAAPPPRVRVKHAAPRPTPAGEGAATGIFA
ncbi:MAG: hypothetical protein KGK11_13305, partial [Sphingomonadales bacterium]|nr:hypothetical protein [Sphingomonadales bacterium]